MFTVVTEGMGHRVEGAASLPMLFVYLDVVDDVPRAQEVARQGSTYSSFGYTRSARTGAGPPLWLPQSCFQSSGVDLPTLSEELIV